MPQGARVEPDFRAQLHYVEPYPVEPLLARVSIGAEKRADGLNKNTKSDEIQMKST
jgi:hypothetical protein